MVNESSIKFDNEIKNKNNAELISGSDEVGRGAMAGPIVVATIVLPANYQNPKIKDSKLLSQKQRTILYDELKSVAIEYSTCIISSKQVDKLNPKQASILGIKQTIINLKQAPDLCLIDAEKIEINNYATLSIIKGDFKSQSIAAASIIAKVTRDRIMENYHLQYPMYGFAKHKGYCTKFHQEKLQEFGISPIHRISYKPVKIILESLK